MYLTENGPEADMQAALHDYVRDGFVEYRHERAPHAQIRVFKRCLRSAALHNWMAFIDADEFLILAEGCAALTRLVRTRLPVPARKSSGGEYRILTS